MFKVVPTAAMSNVHIDSTSRRECLGLKQAQLINMYSYTFRQRSCNQRLVCLLGSMAMNYDLRDESLDKRKVRCLVPCSGQDGSLASPRRFIQIHTYKPLLAHISKLY